jgi:hypothetical protein
MNSGQGAKEMLLQELIEMRSVEVLSYPIVTPAPPQREPRDKIAPPPFICSSFSHLQCKNFALGGGFV